MKTQAINTVKFSALCKRLKLPRYQVVGLLESLWLFAQIQARDGDLTKFTALEIAAWIDWEGEESTLIDALVETRWLDRDDEENLSIHDWNEHKPQYLKGGESTRARHGAKHPAQPEAKPKAQPQAEPQAKAGGSAQAEPVHQTKPNQTKPFGRQSKATKDGSTDDDAAPAAIAPPDRAKAFNLGRKLASRTRGKPTASDLRLVWGLSALEPVLGEAWLGHVVAAVTQAESPPKKPYAYARTVAAKGCRERAGPGEERLRELLNQIPPPPEDWPRREVEMAKRETVA